MKRLVLFVEGEGDVQAVPALIGRFLSEMPPDLQGHLYLDNRAFRVGGVQQLTGQRQRQDNYLNHLKNAARRQHLGAILVVLDGDVDRVEGQPFCPVPVARLLADRGREAGAGALFSLAVVFLRQEYESLLISVADQLPGLKAGALRPAQVEDAPRDAKGWLNQHLNAGYRSAEDQLSLTKALTNWAPARQLRCFRRLEHAIAELAKAVATGQHVASPQPPPPPAAEKS
jgi:hypothetical protein